MSNKSYLSIYAKSFNWAGYFLPKETFKKCSALYDFCRVATLQKSYKAEHFLNVSLGKK